jgi:hypothetical protein
MRRQHAEVVHGHHRGGELDDISVVDLDPWAGAPSFATALALDHRLHQLVLNLPSDVYRYNWATPAREQSSSC